VLASRMISHEDKVEILDRTVKPQASELFLNFLKVLSERGRLNALRPIRRAARELHDQMRGRVRVSVSTATELGDEAAAGIADKLRALLGKEPAPERPQPDRWCGVANWRYPL
jgi:F-type H+-transporting ATPase subunit delta